ncbi:MAG: DUF1232 domain-containing protein, partial [Variovorax sp.]
LGHGVGGAWGSGRKGGTGSAGVGRWREEGRGHCV